MRVLRGPCVFAPQSLLFFSPPPRDCHGSIRIATRIINRITPPPSTSSSETSPSIAQKYIFPWRIFNANLFVGCSREEDSRLPILTQLRFSIVAFSSPLLVRSAERNGIEERMRLRAARGLGRTDGWLGCLESVNRVERERVGVSHRVPPRVRSKLFGKPGRV